MFEDDPMADEYDKHGRYYPKETRIYQVSAISTIEEVVVKNDNLNLFHRGDREAQDKQLKEMNFQADFFRKHQIYIPYSKKASSLHRYKIRQCYKAWKR